MASLLQWLYFSGARAVDGTPVASGTAEFFVPGSTSETVSIYSDPEETPMSQPVTLDAAGRAEVYIKAQAEIRIKSAAGSVLRLTTNGNSIDGGLVTGTWNGSSTGLQTALTAIEASLGADAQYLLKAGATARLYHDQCYQFVTPKDYGAVGNGTTDDTTALQNAITAAIATGLPLNLEAYTYKITSGLTAAGIVNIYGCGSAKSIIVTTATGLTGLTISAASGSYLRDFAIHLPYAGDTYDLALSIAGSTCTVERVDVTGGQGISSTAPYTRIVDCTVTFKCPNTAGAYGNGIYVTQNSLVENCSVNGVTGDDSSYLTRGIYLYYSNGNETTCRAIGGRVVNCYIGGSGGVFLGTEFDTCTTGVSPLWPVSGAIACRFSSCTTPMDFSTGGVAPINIANHFDGTDQYTDCETKYSEDATDAPSFLVQDGYRHFIFKMTYDGTITEAAFTMGALTTKIGTEVRITIQTSADTAITGLAWDTDIVTTDSDPTFVESTWATSTFVVSTAGKLLQVTAWMYGTAVNF